MAKGKKGDADTVEAQDDSTVTSSVQFTSQDEVTQTTNPDPVPPVVEEPPVSPVAEEAPAEPVSEGVKVGDYVKTPYGLQRVHAVFADGVISYAAPGGFMKKIQLPQD